MPSASVASLLHLLRPPMGLAALGLLFSGLWGCASPRAISPLLQNIAQEDINQGRYTAAELFLLGDVLFEHRFGCAEGAGKRVAEACVFDRIHGPEAQTCLECHNQPIQDGAGSLSTNVLRLFDPQTGRFAERNPPHLFGAGYIELLGVEMTAELQTQKAQAVAQARATGQPQERALSAKGIDFGRLRAEADGQSQYLGSAVQADLVVRPFMAKGLDATLRSQNLGALVGHFGIQPQELVGADDADEDGVKNELSVGQVSALVAYEALLPVPSYIAVDRLAAAGGMHFLAIGCADCHTPMLRLEDARYWLADPTQASAGLLLDLPRDGREPRALRLGLPGPVLLPLFSDLRRHDLGPELADPRDTPLARTPTDYLLPMVGQGELPVVPRQLFMTTRLWGVGSTGPYLHDGRAHDLREAILAHGGEGAAARDGFLRLGTAEQASLLSYLASLRIQHGGAAATTVGGS